MPKVTEIKTGHQKAASHLTEHDKALEETRRGQDRKKEKMAEDDTRLGIKPDDSPEVAEAKRACRNRRTDSTPVRLLAARQRIAQLEEENKLLKKQRDDETKKWREIDEIAQELWVTDQEWMQANAFEPPEPVDLFKQLTIQDRLMYRNMAERVYQMLEVERGNAPSY